MKAIRKSDRRIRNWCWLAVLAGSYIWPEGTRADFFVTCDSDNQLRRYDDAGQFIRTEVEDSPTPGAGFTGLTQGPDGALYFGQCWSGKIFRFDTSTRSLSLFAQTPAYDIHGMAFGGPDNDLYTANLHDNTVRVFDRRTGAEKQVYDVSPAHPAHIAVDATGTFYITSRYSGLWRWAGSGVEEMETSRFEGLYLGPDNRLYAATAEPPFAHSGVNSYYLDGRLAATYPGVVNAGFGMVMGPPATGNSLYVATGDANSVIRINLADGTISSFIASVSQPFGVAFGPSGPAGDFAPIEISGITGVPEAGTWISGVLMAGLSLWLGRFRGGCGRGGRHGSPGPRSV